MNKANRAISQISTWLQHHGLAIAPEKTESIVMVGRRALLDIRFEVNGIEVKPTRRLKYLGIWLDHRRSFKVHIEEVSRKCTKVAGCLSRLMENIQEPSPSRRRLLATVVESIALYATPVWTRALNSARTRSILDQVQRKMALRVCSGYRTIAADAAFVIASVPPLSIKAEERVHRHNGMETTEAQNKLLD
ncbi:uncharacterized protein LOC124365538 [Homalodisca vitripennis]|uniref:uncharacterized protein LOC124365538 n=1 Tax=Homalodisca vitripennis TaxID=197043 RepID=UPI001EEA4B2C|nr:uncharacterized protein LOC124365538 [Homalodisca vitripennis]